MTWKKQASVGISKGYSMLKNEKIALYYARAFLNAYASPLSELDKKAITNLFTLFKNNHVLPCLELSTLNCSQKFEMVKTFCTEASVGALLIKLIQEIIMNRRAQILNQVLICILQENDKRQGVDTFCVSTACVLSDDEQQKITHIIHSTYGQFNIVTFVLDPSLINGIRIKSSTVLFDNTIAQKIKEIQQTLLRQVKV